MSGISLERTPKKDTVSFTSRHALDIFYAQNGLKTEAQIVDFLKKHMTPDNILGQGRHFRTYSMGDYALRVRVEDDEKAIYCNGFVPMKNVFKKRNFGQPIATNAERLEIAQKVYGTPLYSSMPKPWIHYRHNPSDIGIVESTAYFQQLQKTKTLSDKALSQYVDDVILIRSKNHDIDHINPNNFLHNEKTGRINILDLCPQKTYKLSSCDLASPLIDRELLPHYYTHLSPQQRKQTLETIIDLEKRLEEVTQKNQLNNTILSIHFIIKPAMSHEIKTASEQFDKINFEKSDFYSAIQPHFS